MPVCCSQREYARILLQLILGYDENSVFCQKILHLKKVNAITHHVIFLSIFNFHTVHLFLRYKAVNSE